MSRKFEKPPEAPVFQGALYKQSAGILTNGRAHRKWCCIYRPWWLYVFEKEDATSSSTILDLRDILFCEPPQQSKKKRKDNLHPITLHTSKSRELFLAASTEDSERWVHEFNQIIQSLRASTTGTATAPTEFIPYNNDTQASSVSSTSKSERSVQLNANSSDNWVIDFKEINFDEGKVLGKGSFGSVQLATWRGSQVAVKTLYGNVGAASDDFFHELAMLCRLHHPNIVQLLGYCSTEGGGPMAQQCLVTEYLPGGSLNQFLNDLKAAGRGLEFKLLLNIGMDTCKGMICLHAEKPPIIHRDLKSANILIASPSIEASVNAKVADFGIATEQSGREHTQQQGTFIYMAPEVFSSSNYTTKVDVFSFGLILWEMCTLERPWKEYKFQFQIEEAIVKGLRPIIPSFVPPELKSIIVDSWSDSPDARPEFSAILKRLRAVPLEQPSWPFLAPPKMDETITTLQSMSIQTTNSSMALGTTTASAASNFGEFAEKILHNLFHTKEIASWTEFSNECSKILYARGPDLQKIRPILVDESGNSVTKRSYTNFLKWFSPLNQEDNIYEEGTKAVTGGMSFSEIKAFLNLPWFHGLIDANTTIKRLEGQESGTYLVRFSGSEPGNYALSLNDGGKIRHWKIPTNRAEGTYTINGHSFPSLIAIVEQTDFSFLVTQLGAVPQLKYPCPKTD